MKKLLGCFLCVMLLFCLATPAAAVPVDLLIGSSNTGDSSEATETAWLWGLGSVTDDPALIDRIEVGGFPGLFDETGFDPGIGGWTYAVVKIGQGEPLPFPGFYRFAYLDLPDGTSLPGDDNILRLAEPFRLGVSHITFF